MRSISGANWADGRQPAIFHCLVRMTNGVANQSDELDLEQQLAASWPVREWRDTHVVLGVSGGADSVALLRAMASLKEREGGQGQLFVAHLNHGLRGHAGDADEEWVKALCERLNVMFAAERMDVSAIAAEQGDGWEAAARSARYDFLRATAERVGARFVVTAHTASDQIETVLHRILRGTGIEGLAGMAKARPLTAGISLVRPMLEVKRDDVLEYLAKTGQEYRTDATNQDMRWTRNRLRHELLPQLRESFNAQIDTALIRLATQAGDAQRLVAGLAATIGEKCVEANATQVRISCDALTGHPMIVVREVFKFAWRRASWPEQAMGFDEWQLLASLAAGGSLKVLNLPGAIRAKRDGTFVILELLAE